LGICLECGNTQSGVEPDAEEYECENCGENKVMGIENAFLIGEVEVSDEDEED
jgi:Zn finger protein HypA/HybF involved in hydrogenase expression